MASPTPGTVVTPQFTAAEVAMQQMTKDNQAFQLAAQAASQAMSTAGIVTNLITSAHSTAGNVAKSVGQGMVESSRR